MIAHISIVLTGYVFAVYGQNNIAFLQSGLGRRHVFVRLINANAPELIVISDKRTDASILACKHHLQITALIGRIIDGVRVKAAQHRVNTVTHNFVGVKRVNIHQIKVLVYGIQHIKVFGYLKIMISFLRKNGSIQAQPYGQQHYFFHSLWFYSVVYVILFCYCCGIKT